MSTATAVTVSRSASGRSETAGSWDALSKRSNLLRATGQERAANTGMAEGVSERMSWLLERAWSRGAASTTVAASCLQGAHRCSPHALLRDLACAALAARCNRRQAGELVHGRALDLRAEITSMLAHHPLPPSPTHHMHQLLDAAWIQVICVVDLLLHARFLFPGQANRCLLKVDAMFQRVLNTLDNSLPWDCDSASTRSVLCRQARSTSVTPAAGFGLDHSTSTAHSRTLRRSNSTPTVRESVSRSRWRRSSHTSSPVLRLCVGEGALEADEVTSTRRERCDRSASSGGTPNGFACTSEEEWEGEAKLVAGSRGTQGYSCGKEADGRGGQAEQSWKAMLGCV